MALTRNDQFTTMIAGDNIATRLSCKRIYLGWLGAAGLVTLFDGAGTAAANTLWKGPMLANTTIEIKGPFNLEEGIKCNTSQTITLVH